MQTEFKKNIALLLLINFIIKPVYILGIDAQVQNTVGPSEYGVYFALFNFCFLFQIILDLGLQNFNSKNISENRENAQAQFAIVLGAKLILILVFSIAVFFAAYLMSYPANYFKLLFFLSLVMALQSMYIYLRSNFSALGHFRTESYLSALDKLLMILVIGFMLYVMKNITIQNFIYGQGLSFLIAIAVALFLLGKKFKPSVNFSLPEMKKIIKKAFPFALVFLLMSLYTKMDGVMLEALLDDNAVSAGIYAAGFRLMDAANMVGYLFAVLLLPMFANLLGNKQEVNTLIRTSSSLLLTISTLIAVLSWFYGDEIIGFIYVDATIEYISVFKILMISFWAMSMSYVFGSLITASGKLKVFNLIFFVGIIVNWSLNLWLIPQYFAWGAAIATLITQFFVFVGQFILAKSMFELKFPLTFILKTIFIVGIYFAIAYAMKTYVSLPWLIEITIIGIFSVFISFLLGFFRLSLRSY